ncbi:MAG: glycosyltransferase [Actinobacteria bacterium]|nr:glycosyltransferase [Actinomycetota bacterium]
MVRRIYRNHAETGEVTFSVIIPCYNYGKYLGECVSSLHAQTMRDFEVIIVNDGSTDDSLQAAMGILEDFQGLLRITLVDQENGGLSRARNSGMGLARGELLCCLDADDLFPENYLEALLRFFRNDGAADIVYPSIRFFGQVERLHEAPDFDRRNLLYWNYLPYSSAYRRCVFEALGGYDPEYRLYEDWDFWLRACAEGFSFRPCRDTFLLYRRHGESMLDLAYDRKKKRLERETHAHLALKNAGLFGERDLDWAEKVLGGKSGQAGRNDGALFIVDYFSPSIGGMETFAAELGTYFVRKGLRFDVATRMLAGRSFRYYRGINIYEFDYDVCSYCDGKAKDYSELERLAGSGDYGMIVMAGDPRIWVTWCVNDFSLPVAMMPIINKENYEFLRRKENALLFREFAKRLRRAKKVVCLSGHGYDHRLAEELGLRPEVIPNAVGFVPPDGCFRERFSIPEDKVLLLHVATYYHIKNQLWLIKHISRMPGNWVLAMIGRVDDEAYYREMVKAVKGDERFMILGPLPRETVAAAMEEADLLLLPSVAESFPLVVLEAMSHRLPWVASDNCSGLQDVPGGRIRPLAGLRRVSRILARKEEEKEGGYLEEHVEEEFGEEETRSRASGDPVRAEKEEGAAGAGGIAAWEGIPEERESGSEGVDVSGAEKGKAGFMGKAAKPYHLAKSYATKGILHAVHFKNVLRPFLVDAFRRIDEGIAGGRLSGRIKAARDLLYRRVLTLSPFMREAFLLAGDRDLRERLGEEGYAAWLRDYNWEKVGERYVRLFDLKPGDDAGHVFMSANPVKDAPEFIKYFPFAVKQAPLVSVIVVFRQDTERLAGTLESVLAQTYGNLEVIVVNGSGESISDFLAAYPDPRVTCVDEGPLSGDAACLNRGIASSRGAYLAYLFEGQRLFPTHCEILLERALSSSSQAVFSRAYRVDGSTRGVSPVRGAKRLEYPPRFDATLAFSDRMAPLQALLHERGLVDEHGLFDESLPALYDWEWVLRWVDTAVLSWTEVVTGEYGQAPDGRDFLRERGDFRGCYAAVDAKHGGRVAEARKRLKDELLEAGFSGLEGENARELLARFPDLAGIRGEIGDAAGSGQILASLEKLDALLEDCGTSAERCRLLSMAYAEAGEILTCKSLLERCLELGGAEAGTLIDLAVVVRRLSGDDEMAAAYVEKALALSPGHGRALELREILLEKAHRLGRERAGMP